MSEVENIRERYERRKKLPESEYYSPLLAWRYLNRQEKERRYIDWIKTCGLSPVDSKRVVEIGCGNGVNLIELMRLGFQPENLVGVELLEESVTEARRRLPPSTQILAGDASEIDLPDASFDVVFQSTVFTSILDAAFQEKLARRMWALVRPGGGILWYDFIYDNPRNPDVRGVKPARVRELFTDGTLVKSWRVTLAPPISRRVTAWHPWLYSLFNAAPWLRTHWLGWIRKRG